MLFFLGRTAKGLVSNLANLAAYAAGLIILVKQHVLLAVFVVGLGLAVLITAAVLKYWFFRFKVEEERIRIRQGVLKKTQLDMRFERIQGVGIEQGPIYRLLDLVTVRFTTAGAAGGEGHLPAVKPAFAAALRERIGSRRSLVEAPAESHDRSVLVRLRTRDLICVGLTDPRVLQFALLGTAFMPALGRAFGDVFDAAGEVLRETLARFEGFGPLVGVVIALGALFVVVAAIALGSIVFALLRYHGYELSLEHRAFRSRAGLFTRKEVVVEATKIQQLCLVQGVRMRAMRRFRLDARSATAGHGSAERADGAEKLTVPLLGESAVEELRERVFASEGQGLRLLPASEGFASVSPVSIWPGALWFGIVPALAGALVLSATVGAVGLWCLAWAVVATLIAWQRWRHRGYLHDDEGLVSRSGLLGYRVDAFLFRKVQRVTVTQSPLERRNGLAGLRVDLASGQVSVPFIEHETARRLCNYILFKAESSQTPWY